MHASDRTPFVVKDCALTALATGEEAWNLRELRELVRRVAGGSLYYHFWGRLLRPVLDLSDFHNDFADWVANSLRDRALGERLALIDPADFEDTEGLRGEVLDVIEERLHDLDALHWAARGEAFHFIEGQLVVFDTHHRIALPEELPAICERLSPGSVFYHFVDARHRSADGRDDFQAWLRGFGDRYLPLCDELRQLDIFFVSLGDLQRELVRLFSEAFPQDPS
jgi:hypothetical protein